MIILSVAGIPRTLGSESIIPPFPQIGLPASLGNCLPVNKKVSVTLPHQGSEQPTKGERAKKIIAEGFCSPLDEFMFHWHYLYARHEFQYLPL